MLFLYCVFQLYNNNKKTQHSCCSDKQLWLTVNQNFHPESVFVSRSATDQFPPSLCPFTCIYKYYLRFSWLIKQFLDWNVSTLRDVKKMKWNDLQLFFVFFLFPHLISLPGPAVLQCVAFSFSFFSSTDLFRYRGQNFRSGLYFNL